MHKLQPHRTGLALGTFVALLHLVWVIDLGLGYGAKKLSFGLGMHFLSNPFNVLAFSWKGGLILVVLSALGGYIMGAVFSFVWNKVAAKN